MKAAQRNSLASLTMVTMHRCVWSRIVVITNSLKRILLLESRVYNYSLFFQLCHFTTANKLLRFYLSSTQTMEHQVLP